ncbi:MAG: endospore germination permease [Dehalobacter sp.]|nr:endospore germination permease [Dehalobacter sp.]
MKIEKGEIASSQLMFLVAATVQCSALMVAFMTRFAKHDTSLIALISLAISILIALVYIILVQKFPGNNLIQINDIIYGTYLGKLVSAQYLLFFILLIPANFQYLGEFVLTYIMPETPTSFIIIMFAIVCAWAVREGLEVIARIGIILAVTAVIIFLVTFVLLLKDMDFTNFLPVLVLPLKDIIYSIGILVTMPFGEILVFLMIIPYVNVLKQAKSSVLLGLIIGGATLLIISIQFTTVLGDTSAIMVSPYFEAVRMINIAGIITRMEILVAIGLMITMFVKVIVQYYAVVLGTAQLFNFRSYLPLVFPIGAISISLAFLSFASPVGTYIKMGWPIFCVYFEILIPLISLLVAQIRKLPK